jgi:hypothetical protein
MFDRIWSGFALARSSWQVLYTDKKLLVFPIISGICCLLVMVSFFTPMLFLVDWQKAANNPDGFQAPPWIWLVLFAYYFCSYFIVVFFNAALISCALVRFNGGTPTIGDGLGAASRCLPQIAAWALVSATVGILLKAIENANEKLGAFISSLLGTAWSVITYFVVPVLVVEKVGPFEAIKRSMAILKRTWGEALVGHVGIGLFVFLLLLPAILLGVVGVYLYTVFPPAGIAVIVLAVLYVLIWLAVGPALNGIFLGAIYQYAAHGQVPVGFDGDTLAHAFRSKRSAA